MKYYAVTDDPRELYHYGVKGMKWGQHIFGDKPKSPGYHKAVSKLKSIMGKTAKAAKTTAAQISYNHRQRQDRKFEKAVERSQRRIAQIEGLHLIDQAQNYERSLSKDHGRMAKQQSLAKKAYKAEKQREMNYAKSEAKMDKYLQQAREGKLKYGKLSENQIHRIQDRLQLESNTRRLESAEKTWRQQKKEARRAGYLSGITRGTAAAMEEVARAGATYGIQHLLDRRKLKSKAKFEGKEDKIKNRERNKKTHKEIQEDLKDELYRTRVEEGTKGRLSTRRDAIELKRIKDERKLLSEQNDNFNSKYLSEYGFKNADDAIEAHRNLLEAKKQTARNAHNKDSEEYRSAKAALNEFNYMSKDEQKRAMLAYDAKVDKADEEKIKKENEEYKIKLEQYKDDLKTYKNKLEKYNQIERDYISNVNEWMRNGAKGKMPIKPYFPKPDEPELPKMPRKLLSGNNQQGGGKKKNKGNNN